MIKCPNCGGINADLSQVCSSCGINLINNLNLNQQTGNYQNQIQQQTGNYQNQMQQQTGNYQNQIQQQTGNYQNQMQQQTGNYQNQIQQQTSNYQNSTLQQTSVVNDDILINAYIGNNVERLRNGSFSWCTLLFAGIYFWYRKMYQFLGIWFVILLILNTAEKLLKYAFITNISTINTIFQIIDLIVPLVLAFQFKDSYIKRVKEKVLLIKDQNPGKKEEELIEICRQKGGTTIAPFIFFASLFIIVYVISLVR